MLLMMIFLNVIDCVFYNPAIPLVFSIVYVHKNTTNTTRSNHNGACSMNKNITHIPPPDNPFPRKPTTRASRKPKTEGRLDSIFVPISHDVTLFQLGTQTQTPPGTCCCWICCVLRQRKCFVLVLLVLLVTDRNLQHTFRVFNRFCSAFSSNENQEARRRKKPGASIATARHTAPFSVLGR